MEDNKEIITELIGQKKFDEEIELLEKLVKSESKGGKFIAKEGDVDTREASLQDIHLDSGFKT
jgi:hypothetical protein